MMRARMRWLVLSAMLLVLVPTLAACGPGNDPSLPGNRIRIGLVTDTTNVLHGLNWPTYLGMLRANTAFAVHMDVLTSASGADYRPNLERFASDHYDTTPYDLVIAGGFDMGVAVGTVSGEYPDVHFAIFDADPRVCPRDYIRDYSWNCEHNSVVTRTNVQTIRFAEQEAGALVGVVAGMLAKQLRIPDISAVGGQYQDRYGNCYDVDPIEHYIAGYQWAATMEAQRDPVGVVQVHFDHTCSLTDRSMCHSTANDQISAGSVIVFAVAGDCGLGALQAAGERGVFSIGVDTDQRSANHSVIASAVKRADNVTYLVIQDLVLTGTFRTGAHTYGISTRDDGVDVACGVDLPCVDVAFGNIEGGLLDSITDITNEVHRVEAAIRAGTCTVPSVIDPMRTDYSCR